MHKKASATKLKIVFLFIVALVLSAISIFIIYNVVKNNNKKPVSKNSAVSTGKENKKELTPEQKKVTIEKEKLRSEQKNKSEQCKSYYEQLDKYTKSITGKSNDRNKKIRELAQKYPIESEEYKSALGEINKQYSGIFSSSKPPSKPKNC